MTYVPLTFACCCCSKLRNSGVKGVCIPSKNKLKTQKYTELRWLASEITFKLLNTGCSIDHAFYFNLKIRNLCCHLDAENLMSHVLVI